MRIPTPTEIEAAAKAKGLSVASMCRRADLETTAFYRWRAGGGITVGTVQRLIDAIDRAPEPNENAA